MALTGCFPVSDSQSDDSKEPNFMHGKSLVTQMDFQGAGEAFEKALEVNPRSAPAHFELAWLCEEKLGDPAAAIYHYNQYLKCSSTQEKADVVKQHISSCKLELARNVSAISGLAPAQQREFDRVIAENKNLQEQVADLQSQISQLRTLPAPAHPAPAAANLTASAAIQPPAPKIVPQPPVATQSGGEPVFAASHLMDHNPSSSAGGRTYIIKAGDTLAGIARKYRVSLNQLTSANPQARPTHLVVGQTLIVPGQ
jgi:LysM repeat protein